MQKEFVKYPEIGRIYNHYKGGKYEVITLAKHSETDETLVIYKSLHFGSIHARPLKMWFEVIQKSDATNYEIVRFSLYDK